MTKAPSPRPTGKNALEQMYRGRRNAGPGLVFLDFDDVICTHSPYSGYDVFQAMEDQPADLYERLWHAPAVDVLLGILTAHGPKVVITSSWLRLMKRDGFNELFLRTGLDALADALHVHWEAPASSGMTRLEAIERWLNAHYQGEPLVILDDELSGTGLRGSRLDRAGCVVLCRRGVGLMADHLPHVNRALGVGPVGGSRPGSGQRRR